MRRFIRGEERGKWPNLFVSVQESYIISHHLFPPSILSITAIVVETETAADEVGFDGGDLQEVWQLLNYCGCSTVQVSKWLIRKLMKSQM